MSTALPISPAESSVETVLRRAWRRRLLLLVVDHSALALAVIFGGLALLILLGTEILAWPWLLLIAMIGIGIAISGVRRQLADPYAVAQIMDQRLQLDDSLSTAWHLRHHGSSFGQPVTSFQLRHADQLARNADLTAAFPFRRGRGWIVTGCLCALAIGLFSARYLVTHELSLQRPFLPTGLTQVLEYVRNRILPAERNQQAGGKGNLAAPPPAGAGQETPSPRASPQPQASASQPGNQAAASNGKSNHSPDRSDNQEAGQSKSSEGENGDAQRNGGAEGTQAAAHTAAGKEPSNERSEQDPKQQDSPNPQNSNSLMDRMRDALSSVMAKIKPSGQKDAQSGSQKSSEGQRGSEQAGSKDQSSDGQQKDAGKEQSAQEQSSGQQQGQGAAKAQTSGKDASQASDKKGSDAQSGVGHSDGDKEVKAAEQAKAMGKLAEIIGKRSANLTGDMQVEPSGKQRLQTDYTHQQGRHADLGGEINRDEVGVEDQEYVREYMELVRKDARKKPPAPTISH